jgi:uncharacterized protein YqeY
MTATERLGQEIKTAMREKNAERLGALRLLKSAVGYAAIEKKVDSLSDADFVSVVQKEAKKRRDAIEQFEQGGRPELAAKEKLELIVLEEFLPKPLSSDEVEQLVRVAIVEAGAASKKDMGAVMKLATTKAAGRADGRTLSGVAARLLP